jgi:hypothetical protein
MSVDPKLAGNVIQILANIPDFLRRPILQRKLEEFYSMADDDKHETISLILKAIALTEHSKLSVLTKTWMDVLSEFEGIKVTTMFRVYCEELLRNPDYIKSLDIEFLMCAFSSLDDGRKEHLADCLKEAILWFPKRTELLNMIPKPALKMLNIQ